MKQNVQEFEKQVRSTLDRLWEKHGYGEVPPFPYEPDWQGMMEMTMGIDEHAEGLSNWLSRLAWLLHSLQ